VLIPATGALAIRVWLQISATPADTLTMKMVEQPRDWFNTVSGIASILISIALLAHCVGLIPAAWNFRKSYAKVNDLLEKVYGDVNPLMRHASTIADNVNYISTSIRVDVQQVNQTIATANERLQEAVRLTERRVAEFNALLHVVQREAEDTFVSTASALRGVREGAATFREDALGESQALRRARLGAALQRAEALAFDEALEEADDELDALAEREALDEFDELDDLDDMDDLDDLEELEELEPRIADAPGGFGAGGSPLATDIHDALESGELSDGYVRGRPPVAGGSAERPRIRSRRRPTGDA
jgi:uncharacterized protein YoxC